VASEPQALDATPLIRRKRAGEAAQEPPDPLALELQHAQPPAALSSGQAARETALRMKPRETIQLAAVHVRIPEQLARGLRLMSVLEGRQAQVIVAEMLEEHLTRWNANWRSSVPPRGT